MTTFIREIVDKIYQDHHGHLDEVSVIFPNRRAGLFFRNELGKLIDKPVWMPRIASFEDFILAQSSLRKIETLEAVFLLYESYKQYPNREEPFDKFFFWGEMILRDFEEIDQYMVDADRLFTSIKTQKELDEAFYFLDDEEKSIIQSFWLTFFPDTSKTQKAFLETWKILKPVYHDYRSKLIAKGKGYGGLIYREFLKELEAGDHPTDLSLIFAGFNALTHVEEAIIKYYVKERNAELVWDIDGYYMNDTSQEAGTFLRGYRNDTILGKSFPEEPPSWLNQGKGFTATGVSLEVGQAKAMAEVLSELTRSEEYSPEKTVVVLPQEYMLFPVLHALPEAVENVNITMGYPLKDTTIYSLIESLLRLQSTRRENLVHGSSFYHKPVVEILEHPLLQSNAGSGIHSLLGEIKKRNLIFLYQDELPQKPEVLELIFSKPEQPLAYLMEILSQLHKDRKDVGGEMEVEFIARFYEHVSKLRDMMGERAHQLGYDFLLKLFKRLSNSLKVPFTGEPLNGIQIMGILETRNLDFENVFILNMNEGSWPAPPKRGSFVPYNIRKAFQLPVFEHQDAIYSYLFYRLLQRAKRVHFFYNTVSEFNVNGELSRLVQQLEFESGHKIKKRILANPIKVTPPQAIIVDKTEQVLDKLNRFLVKAGEWTPRLTPSALDTYLYCRLRFYFRYILELYEPDELQEELDPMVFGNILHDTMEILYSQFIKKQKRDIIEPNDFFWLEGGIDGAINKAFISHYKVKNEKKFKLEGRNIIAAEIIRKTALKILKFDRQYAPFKIIGLETSTKDGYTLDYPVESNGRKILVGLKGKIDRIDLKQGKIRVIDYKTGKDKREFANVESLIDRENDKRNKAVFQVFFYSYLFMNTYNGAYDQIEPGLFNSRDLFDENFNWQIIQKEPRSPATDVSEFRQFLAQFEYILSQLLTEIWNPDIPFDQISDEKKCRFCAYKEICGRGI